MPTLRDKKYQVRSIQQAVSVNENGELVRGYDISFTVTANNTNYSIFTANNDPDIIADEISEFTNNILKLMSAG